MNKELLVIKVPNVTKESADKLESRFKEKLKDTSYTPIVVPHAFEVFTVNGEAKIVNMSKEEFEDMIKENEDE